MRINRRALVAVTVTAIALDEASASELGESRLRRDNERCDRWARTYSRRGLLERMRPKLIERGCKEDPIGTWVSDRVYTADV